MPPSARKRYLRHSACKEGVIGLHSPMMESRHIHLLSRTMVAAFLLAGCDNADLAIAPPKGKTPPAQLPARWTLTDVEGRTVKATIIGRSETAVTLVRETDGQRFVLPVARLADSDQRRVATLPIQKAPQKSPAESSIYRMRQAKMDEVRARINEINQLIGGTNSDIQLRSYNSELKRLYKEESKLREELRELEDH